MDAQEISFEDIRVGDTIRQVRITSAGGTATVELTVDDKDYDWVSGQNLVAYKGSAVVADYTEWKFELLDRPEPKDHILVRINADGTESIVTINVVTLSQALEKRRDLLSIEAYRGRTYELRKVTKA